VADVTIEPQPHAARRSFSRTRGERTKSANSEWRLPVSPQTMRKIRARAPCSRGDMNRELPTPRGSTIKFVPTLSASSQ